MPRKSPLAEIKKNINDKKLVLGTKSTIKNIRLGKLEKAFITNNCPEKIKEDINYYGSISGCKVEHLNIPNDELGVICKKQFVISVAGLLKQ